MMTTLYVLLGSVPMLVSAIFLLAGALQTSYDDGESGWGPCLFAVFLLCVAGGNILVIGHYFWKWSRWNDDLSLMVVGINSALAFFYVLATLSELHNKKKTIPLYCIGMFLLTTVSLIGLW